MTEEKIDQEKSSTFKKDPTINLLVTLLIFLLIIGGYLAFAYKLTLWPFTSKQTIGNAEPNDKDESKVKAGDISFTQLYKTSFGFIEEKKGMTIRSQAELEELWPNITPLGGNNPLPSVDFSNEKVAVVSLGNYSGCNKLAIDRAYKHNNIITVQYTITSPEGICPCTMDKKLFLEMVKFPAGDETIEFDEKHSTEECWNKR